MPIYTLDDLRRVANSAGVSGSDEFLIKDYASRSGMDPAHVANRLGYDGGTSTLTRERLSGAVDNYQSGLYETGAAVAGALGLEGARKFAERKAADNRFQADVAGARAKQLGGVDSYEDVDGVSSGLNYLGGLAAQSLPYAAEALVGGFAGRIGATGLKAAALAGRTAGATEEAVRAGTAAQRALDLRSMGGATVASYPSSMGDVLGNQREQIETSGGEMDYGSAAVGAVPYSLLNGALGINSLAARGRLARVGTDMLDGMQGFKGGAARMGATVGKTMLEEGSSELGQEGVNQYFGRMAVDPNEEFLTDGSRKRFAESFVGGAALGGAFGSIGGHRRSEGYKPTNTNVPDPDQTTPREWTTSQGFENLQRETPQFDGETPDWALSQGFEGVTAIPRGFDLLNGRRPTGTQIPAVDASGLYGDHNEQLPLNNVKLANDLGVPNIPPVRNTMDDGASLDFTPTTAYAAGDGEVSGMGGIGGRPGQGSYMSEEDMLNDPGAAVARAAQMKEQQRLAEIKKTALAHAEKIKAQEAAAKEFGIKGTKGVGLFVELNELHQAGKITDGELAENIGLLGAKHNGSVEKWIKGQAIVKQTLADANKADKEAVMTALTKKGAKNVSTAPTAGAVAGNAGQQPSSVNAGSQSVSGSQPVGGTGGGSVPAARADGASKTSVAVQPASVSPAPVVPEKSPGQRLVEGLEAHTGKRFTPKDKSRLFLTAGLDKDGYPSGPKLTYDQAASVEAALSGKGKAISREGFSKNLRALGVTDDLVHRFTDRLEQQDLEVADSDVVQENTDGTLAADSQEEFDSPKTADEIEMNVIEDPDVPNKQGQTKGAEVVRAVGESTGFSVKTGANSGGDGGTAKRIVESLLDLLDAKTPVTKTGGGEPILNDTQRNEVYRVLAAGSGLVSDESPKPNMSRKELSDKAKAKSIEAAHRVIERTGQLLTRTDVFSPHMIDMLNELVGGTKAKNVEDAKRNIVAEAIRANAGPTPEQLAQIAKNKAIIAENERRMAEFEAEVEKAEGLRAILGDHVSNGDILDAEEAWGEYVVDGDPNWDDLTEREQANWVRATIARYSVKPESTHSAEKAYGQKFDDIADGARNRLRNAENAAGSRTAVGGAAPAVGGKVPESSTRGSAAEASGQEAPSGEAPRGAGGVGDGTDQARSGPVTLPTITVKKKRTIVKPDGGTKFSTNPTEGGSTVDQVYREFAELGIRPNSRKVVVVQSVGDVPQSVRGQVGRKSAATGSRVSAFVSDGKAWFIADNIPQGKARSKFMHEVGSHLGLDGLLTEQQMDNLFATIVKWADKNDSSQESKLARQAIARTGMAVTPDEDIQSEVIAYFIEEALDAGIDPTAMSYKGELARWFRALYAAFKSAIRKLGRVNADKLTAQDVVDLAYGAAKLEMEGTWHGTAADFRKFDHRYMGSGEGAQAYGWGSYLAQRPGIAKGYFDADVRRKSPKDEKHTQRLQERVADAERELADINRMLAPEGQRDLKSLAKQNSQTFELLKRSLTEARVTKQKELDQLNEWLADAQRKAPEGNLMRTDVNVADNEWLDWDKPLSEQSEKVRSVLESLPELGMLGSDEDEDGGRMYREIAYQKGSGKAASEYLDGLGVKGVRFLDNVSRNLNKRVVVGKSGAAVDLGLYSEADRAASSFIDGFDTLPAALVEAERQGKQYPAMVGVADSIRGWIADGYELTTPPLTYNFVVFDDKNIQRVMSLQGADREKAKFSIAPSVRDTARRVGGSTGAMLYEDATHQATKAVRSLAFLHDLVAEYKDKLRSPEAVKSGAPSPVQEWYKSLQATVSARMEMEEPAERIAAEALKLKDGAEKVNTLVAKATTQQKWPYDPKIAGKQVTPDPVLAREFGALSKEEQKVVRDIFDHGEHMRQYEQDLMTRLDLGGILTAYTKLDGPYAPLKRFGNYIAILKSQELRDAEQNDDKKKVEELKKDPKHYTVSFFDTKGLAMEFANINDKANGGAYDFSTYGEKDVRVGEEMPTDHAVIQRVLAAIKGGDLDPKAKEAATNLIRDMYFQSIDEHHARVHGLKRKNIAGYSEDMVRAFLHHARAQANFLANLEHGGETNEQFYTMKKEARKSANDKLDNQDIVNTFAAHYEESLKYKETPIQDRMMALTSAWQLATSVGYHLANFMQPIMATLPRLASDFNDYSGAWKHLLDAYGTLKTTGIRGHLSLDGIRDEGLQATLQRAVELQLMDMGMDSDISSFEATHTGIAPVDAASRGVKKALHNLRQVSRAVETANRVSSAVAAYNMARQKGKTEAQAQEYAINILQTTQGDSTRMGAPLLLKRLPKIMTQYKKFQFMMAAMYVKAFRQAFKGATAEERAIGRRMLAYKLFHTSMAAGVMGMPLMNLVQIVFNMLGADGDEPPDFERWLKEQGAPDALLHGPLSFMGTDAKLGEEKVFSILPYADWDITSATGVKNMVAGLLGPAVSQGLKVADGIGAIKNGDYYKGVEKMMPSGVANGMKAFRVANDGYTLKNGDVMFKPDDINGAVLALDALGLPSSQMKNIEWLRSQQYQIGKFYNDRSKAIERDYLKAFKDGDTDAMMEARESWMSLQAGKDEMRHWFGDSAEELKRQPLSTLLKYPQTVSKRESKLQKGALVE